MHRFIPAIRYAHWLLLIYACMMNFSWAGALSLYPNQVDRLRQLLAENSGAARYYAEIRRTADATLNDMPNPVTVIISEGKLASDPAKIKSNIATRDFKKILALSWAWLISKDDKYIVKGKEFILAWSDFNMSDGNPINETTLEPLIIAYDIFRPQFSQGDREKLDNWLTNRAIVLWNDKRGRTGNWQSHRIKMIGLIATVTEDNKLWKLADAGFKEQIDHNFFPDGVSKDFNLRDAMHYHLYSVLPLLTLACVARQRHSDWYVYQAPSGASLKRAVIFIEPYAFGVKKHLEFVHSTAKFDKVRADAGEKEYSPHIWNPCAATQVFAEATCVDPDAKRIAAELKCNRTHKNDFVSWQSVVNSIKYGIEGNTQN